jgi:hypothetical protein
MKLPPKARARHKEEGQAKVRCNALYKTQKNLNVKLKATQALQLAKGLIQRYCPRAQAHYLIFS